MPFGFADTFEVQPIDKPKLSPWLTAPLLFEAETNSPAVPDTHKKAFAIEWAKYINDPFKAALVVFEHDTTSALWASRNWILDPEVNAIKDSYLKAIDGNKKLLDREETARKFLSFFDETTSSGKPAYDGKDRLTALVNYSKMMGFMEDSVIKNTINNNNTIDNRKMEIVFVEPDAKLNEKLKVLDAPNNESKILESEEIESTLGIKLVG